MVMTLFFGSLVIILGLFLWQSMLLRNQNLQNENLRSRLSEMDKEASLGRLLTGVAHDLNTPLSALDCTLNTRQQALKKLVEYAQENSNESENDPSFKKIIDALNSTDSVVNESLHSTREIIDHLRKVGRGEPEGPQLILASKVMSGALLLLGGKFKPGVNVNNQLDPDLQVFIQPGNLGRVFANLLINAVDAMDGTGEIKITSQEIDQKCIICIEDSGPGLPTSCPAELFCSGWTTKSKDNGSGLGLYICQNILREAGGDLLACNHTVDGAVQGAQMKIELPVPEKGGQ